MKIVSLYTLCALTLSGVVCISATSDPAQVSAADQTQQNPTSVKPSYALPAAALSVAVIYTAAEAYLAYTDAQKAMAEKTEPLTFVQFLNDSKLRAEYLFTGARAQRLLGVNGLCLLAGLIGFKKARAAANQTPPRPPKNTMGINNVNEFFTKVKSHPDREEARTGKKPQAPDTTNGQPT